MICNKNLCIFYSNKQLQLCLERWSSLWLRFSLTAMQSIKINVYINKANRCPFVLHWYLFFCWMMQNTPGHLSMVFFSMNTLWNSFMWNSFVTLARPESNFTGRKKKWLNLFTLSCSQVLSCVSMIISMTAYFLEMFIQMMSPQSSLWFYFLYDS